MDSDEATTVCKRDALGRVKAPMAQREALLDEFERCSMSEVQFARAAGLHYQTFAWWVLKHGVYGDSHAMPHGVELHEYVIQCTRSLSPEECTLSISAELMAKKGVLLKAETSKVEAIRSSLF